MTPGCFVEEVFLSILNTCTLETYTESWEVCSDQILCKETAEAWEGLYIHSLPQISGDQHRASGITLCSDISNTFTVSHSAGRLVTTDPMTIFIYA